jgi:hypothetical protein
MAVCEPVGPCVTVFGSARLKAGTTAYDVASQSGQSLSGRELGIMTGGGPRLMEAVTCGASNGRAAACRVAARYMFVWSLHEVIGSAKSRTGLASPPRR